MSDPSPRDRPPPGSLSADRPATMVNEQRQHPRDAGGFPREQPPGSPPGAGPCLDQVGNAEQDKRGRGEQAAVADERAATKRGDEKRKANGPPEAGLDKVPGDLQVDVAG
jgi:hypothetical protein